MPIFMDRHDVPGITAMDVAEAHRQDLKIQDRYGCRALTYWFDEKRGTAFCLVEAPQKEAVEKMHDEAHGLIPRNIIEVDGHVVEAFLGRITDPETAVRDESSDLLLFEDPAFRIILATELKDAPLVKSKFGVLVGLKLLEAFNEIVQKAIAQYEGQEVKKTVDGFMASFSSVSKAVQCALALQERFQTYNRQMSGVEMHVAIGLSAGEPVTGREDFFGEAIRFAKRLCYIGDASRVMVSSTVRDEYRREEIGLLSEEDSIRILSPLEEQFLNQLMDLTEQVWNEETFKVADFGRELGLSKAQFYRKITALTGHAPNQFIKEFRLKKAVELIEKQQGNISQIAFETGFGNPSYFSKCFQKRFGILPSDFAHTIA
jgi:AraC-like DNA-binding protein